MALHDGAPRSFWRRTGRKRPGRPATARTGEDAENIPLAFVVNGCSTGDNGTPRGRSVIVALSELGEYAPLGKLGSWPIGSPAAHHP